MHHRIRAQGALLANVRTIDEKAALAWGAEALVAEKRERRQDRTIAIAAKLRERKRLSLEQRGSSLPRIAIEALKIDDIARFG